MMQPSMHEFSGPWALAGALATTVADDLRAGIQARGGASLVVSGGTTPRRFMQELSRQVLAWERVTITLADERWVPPDHPRSNERLVRENLLSGNAGAAVFVSLYANNAATAEDALDTIAARIDALALPFDGVLLGMGADGHCASLFPHGDRLQAALQPHAAARVSTMRAADAQEPRITLTLSALVQTRALYLHIEGVQKKQVLEAALAGTPPFEQAPIAAVLSHAATTPQVFYCP